MPETQVLGSLTQGAPGDSPADEVFDRIVRIARRTLDVQAASFIVLGGDDVQYLPGAVGLPEEVQRSRVYRLDRPATRIVAETRTPLIVPDVADEPLVAGRGMIAEMGVRALAGYPVEDSRGEVVGALWALSEHRRDWTDADLATLSDLAASCTGELRLRAERERARRAEQVAFRAHQRAQFLLGLSERFAGVTTIEEIEETIAQVVGAGMGARWCSLALVDADRRHLRYVTVGHQEPGFPDQMRNLRLDAPRPDVAAVREQRTRFYRDHQEMIAAYPAMAGLGLTSTGARSFLPIIADDDVVGVVVCVWADERDHDAATAALETTVTRYVAMALERVALLEARRRVATTLQESLLTDPPAVAHLDIATTYAPAARTDQVGGDWYDAVVHEDGAAVLSIGDVAGHDVNAAAQMGQLRSMLRVLAWSHDESPAALLSRLDRADSQLGLHAMATAVVVRLDHDAEPRGDTGPDGTPERGYTLTWSDAGHPPPLVLRRDGSVEELEARPDMLLGVDPGVRRRDHVDRLLPGDTLVLYTDGLVERRGVPLGDRMAELKKALADVHGEATAALPRALVRRLVGRAQRDDVAVLVARARVPAPSGPPSAAGPATAERKVAHEDLSDLGPARRWVDDVLESCSVDAEQRRTAMLLSSEILTNALEHGRGPIVVTVEVDATRLRVAVRDGCTRRPVLQAPTPQDLSGRGVQFMERLASRWGVEQHLPDAAVGRHGAQGEGKTVWFEIDRSARPLTGVVPVVRRQSPSTSSVPLVERVLPWTRDEARRRRT
ncbi:MULTISPECIES: SpoIIE family protein phosphatase [unclassified Isoptericola]|uniref:SpoIIE family protein phosphatase n=1 Tax=unclassified Isoptericola TaxID=2623355 RepID=UPI002712218B|nr:MULTISPECIES: SpoIIE family protein phosphatase [unclassified Isoptericola]MDO8145780.1 SpoIIE family protein phosphatase [Isoptericola sp. 178]MDO8147879.1 SpoIIE family protein phosphatase [Isoptericola sp. b515]MDO8149860.1 SpoIIE family protein phosphatase [Isoptericola sp. b408]